MITPIQVQVGKKTVTAYEYTKFAFSTSKGTFTLIGSNTNGIDTFKCLETGEWHEWSRVQLYEWLKQGKISPEQQANGLDWYIILKKENNRLESFKMLYK